jgi:hypothetical protein
MRLETFAHADIAALQALQASLDAAATGRVAVGLAPLNAPSHNQNRGEVKKLPTEARKPQFASVGLRL